MPHGPFKTGIMEEAWVLHRVALLPPAASQHEEQIARESFLQGFRALYALIHIAWLMAQTQEEFAAALEQLGLELEGNDSHRPRTRAPRKAVPSNGHFG